MLTTYAFVFFSKDARLPVQLQRAMAAEAEAAREARAKVRTIYIYISMVTGMELYNEAYIQMKTFSHLIKHTAMTCCCLTDATLLQCQDKL